MVSRIASKQYLFIYFALGLIAVGIYFAIRYFPSAVTSSPHSITSCDINRDAYCDLSDLQMIYSAMGACKGESKYRVDFDVDRDGCLTEEKDLEKLKNIYYKVLDQSKVPTPSERKYDAACDYDRDGDCDKHDDELYWDILDEKAKIKAIVEGITVYHISVEEYPKSLEDLVPNFIPELPLVAGLQYEPVKGQREYQLCYTTIETVPPSRVCLTN